MTIGIDGNEANTKERVGIGQYAYQLLSHLNDLERRRINKPTNRYIVYLKNAPSPDLPKISDFWRYKVFGPSKLWTQIALPLELYLSRDKIDVFFSPSHYVPRFSPLPHVMSIMDVSFLFFPELFRKKDLYQLKEWTAYSVKKAVSILTISHFSRNSIIDAYKVSPDRVVVTYPGYDKKSFRKDRLKTKDQDLIKRLGIRGRYILFVGTIQPRKNITKLLDAFETIQKEHDISLVLVGKKGWLTEPIFEKIGRSPLKNRIIWLNYVSNSILSVLYRGAQCFVLPSLYEGFGIPAIEAMACGCPVVVSKTTSLPEIVGNAGVLVDPLQSESIAEGLSKVMAERNFRDIMIRRGLEEVKRFDWGQCAKQTLKVLENVHI
ncbi:glycosyltransferase family 4 protein [Candidatus Gottesmanbacteria bacterium]|nr:glycosyltransferase family 4 protein [Candidatus Gottesmanbacteria bacterium]